MFGPQQHLICDEKQGRHPKGKESDKWRANRINVVWVIEELRRLIGTICRVVE